MKILNMLNSCEMLDFIINNAIKEDIGDGDHTSLSCIPAETIGRAKLLIKQDGVIAGIDVAKRVFNIMDENLKLEQILNDGDNIKIGDIAFTIEGKVLSILQAERLVLNIMQISKI